MWEVVLRRGEVEACGRAGFEVVGCCAGMGPPFGGPGALLPGSAMNSGMANNNLAATMAALRQPGPYMNWSAAAAGLNSPNLMTLGGGRPRVSPDMRCKHYQRYFKEQEPSDSGNGVH